jgi:hypothetical protein
MVLAVVILVPNLTASYGRRQWLLLRVVTKGFNQGSKNMVDLRFRV